MLTVHSLSVSLNFVSNRFSIKPLSSTDIIDALMVLVSSVPCSAFDWHRAMWIPFIDILLQTPIFWELSLTRILEMNSEGYKRHHMP